MDARIGAFLQRAVVKTFGLPHSMPKNESEQLTNSQPDSMIGCWPQNLKDTNLRRSYEGSFDTDISGHSNKRTRSARRSDCSDYWQEAKIPPSPKQEAVPRPSLFAEDNYFQGSPVDTEDKLDLEPYPDQAGSQSLFFGEESNDIQHNPVVMEGASSYSPCPDQDSPQRSACFEEEDEDICEEDRMYSDDFDQDTPLIRGPSRMVTVNDDGKDRLAMFITDDMLATFNEIKEANEDIAKTVKKLKAAERESRDLIIDIEEAEEKLGDAQDEDNADETKLELEKLQLKLQKNAKRMNVIKKGMWPFESNLRRSTEEFQNLFGDVLQAAARFGQSSLDAQPLAEETDIDMDSEQHSEQESNDPSDSQCQSRSGSESNSESESALLSPEDLLRRSVTEDLEQSLWILMDAQAKFDDRQDEYKRELAKYNQLIAMDEITYTRTEFDIHSIQYVQGLTTQLKDAENRYEIAKSQAKALGLSVDPYDDNVDDHGYRESQEASVVAKVDRGGIETWSSKVTIGKSFEVLSKDDRTLVDIDEWNPRPVDPTESCSVVDFQGYGGDIKVWQKHCDTLREQSIQNQPEDVWRSTPMSMKRRGSI